MERAITQCDSRYTTLLILMARAEGGIGKDEFVVDRFFDTKAKALLNFKSLNKTIREDMQKSLDDWQQSLMKKIDALQKLVQAWGVEDYINRERSD